MCARWVFAYSCGEPTHCRDPPLVRTHRWSFPESPDSAFGCRNRRQLTIVLVALDHGESSGVAFVTAELRGQEGLNHGLGLGLRVHPRTKGQDLSVVVRPRP